MTENCKINDCQRNLLLAEIAELRTELETWKERYEAVVRDHEATIHHAGEMMRELHNSH